MAKMIIKKNNQSRLNIGLCIVSTTYCTHFKFAVYFVMFQISNNQKETLFHIYLLIHECNVISNLNQSRSFQRTSTKPEVFVLFSKGQVLGSQPEVKVKASFLQFES